MLLADCNHMDIYVPVCIE